MIYKHKQTLGNFQIFGEIRLQLKTNKRPITFDLLKTNPPNFLKIIYIRINRCNCFQWTKIDVTRKKRLKVAKNQNTYKITSSMIIDKRAIRRQIHVISKKSVINLDCSVQSLYHHYYEVIKFVRIYNCLRQFLQKLNKYLFRGYL